MLRKSSSIPNKLINFLGAKNLGLKRPTPTSKELPEYDIVIVGGNLGGILSRHIEDTTHHHYKIMVVSDQNVNPSYPLRGVYEQQRVSKNEYFLVPKMALDGHTASGDVTSIDKYLPDENAVVLRTGRKIGYKQLVIATGLQDDYSQIKGFESAWQDFDVPVFTCNDHPTWNTTNHKYARWIHNFKSGDAYFCIPPYPFKGEIGGYNFFLARSIWNTYLKNGLLSPLHSFTIMNANDRFVQYLDSADTFIKDEIRKRRINVQYGQNLVEIDSKKLEATFQDVKTGKTEKKTFSNLYSLAPTKINKPLVDAGLASAQSNYCLDVDQKTMQHNKYKNIFGVGDVNNLPTTRTYWGGFYQLHVVRNNIVRNMHGQKLNAQYDGYTKCALLLAVNRLTYVIHYYNQQESPVNLLDSAGGIISMFRYYFWGNNHKKRFASIYLGKSHGPPYGKLMKPKFAKPAGEPSDSKIMNKLFAVNKAKGPAHHGGAHQLYS